ncbi:hypothetical protein [Winogradskyella luteola]|uniref:DUF3278 domain-containing protein n=1 Tax=Winogradskyella luteola TaxID=2828330 RepID=A0A9X1F7N6_9FLAO|nr:hypothetical protein [Winogradskyella luteola]MBV7268952.1 hypothetical protein [Winogradskyella luteola]
MTKTKEMLESRKTQHREFVQSVITRMNTNSFQIKGMMVTILAAFLAIYASNKNILFIVIPIPIVTLFWLFDAYYIQLERKFRGIYKDICDLTPEKDIKTKMVFEMNPKLYTSGQYNYWNVLFKSSVTPFYLIINITLVICYFILKT